MHSLTAIVIALGVVLTFMLLIVTFTVWRFFRQRTEDDLRNEEELFTEKYNENIKYRDSFEVPINYRRVQQQLGFDKLETSPKEHRMGKTSSAIQDYLSKRRSSVTDRRRSDYEVLQYLPTSLNNELLDESNTDLMHKRMSNGAIENLLKKDDTKYSSLGDLSIPEVEILDECGEVLTNSLSHLEETDAESLNQITENCEIYDSSALIMGKKRRRKVSRTRSIPMKTLKRTFKKAGKINFLTYFNREENEFEVHILRAYNLAPRRNIEDINPFVRVYLFPGKKHRQGTKMQKSTKDPFINEKFIFGDLVEDNLSRYRLKLKVCTRTAIKKEVLGEVDIALNSINLDKRENFNIDLLKRRSQSSLASIHISMCHEATSSQLNVIIHEINNLPKGAGLSGNPDPYVVVTLTRDANTPNEKKCKEKTTVKRNTRNPLFNESLKLDAFTDSETPLSSYTLVATIKNAAIIKKDETLGHVVFDMRSSQKSAINHWKSVEMTPHEPHNMWHSLLDPDEI